MSDESPELRRLTPLQRRFVDEYMVDHNAQQAAIRAGYSKKTAKQSGYQAKNYPHVKAEIERREAERRQRLGVDADWIIASLVGVYEKSFAGAPKVDRHGELITYYDEESGERRFVEEWSPSGANKALELLAKHLGIAIDRQSVEVDTNIVYTLTLDRTLGDDEPPE